MTAITGAARCSLDQRALDADELREMLAEAARRCRPAPGRRAARSSGSGCWQIEPIPFDAGWSSSRGAVVESVTGTDRAAPAAPLHDAAEMARVIPTVMVFSKSSPAVSHTPERGHAGGGPKVAMEAYGKTVAATLAAAAEGDLPPMG